MNSSAKAPAKRPKSTSKATVLPICQTQVVPPLDTASLFDTSKTEPVRSALDQFLEATAELNKLLPPPPAPYQPHLGHLVLLGYMSAVESFFRTMIRRVIVIDEIAQKKVYARDIAYAAAMHHTDPKILPEALFERTTFISKKNVISALQDFLDIKDPPREVKDTLDEFAKVCELRHCLVHRFGKLGSRNAIELGIKAHSRLFEKPLAVPYARMQDAFGVLHQTVRIINNFVFHEVVGRIEDWSWSLTRDRRRFGMYYAIFATVTDVTASPSADDCYRSLRQRQRGY